jgi:light-regulated signal transduction histidine kinase (bacteriophytochrome)
VEVCRPRVEFGVRRDDDEAVYWVRDNGAGFDMAYVSRGRWE